MTDSKPIYKDMPPLKFKGTSVALKESKAIAPNKKLEALTINESLGDIPTHFMKSGSSYRPKKDLTGLAAFKERIIPESYREAKFEYDIWFNTNENVTVRKWLYTDFLGNGIYIRVPSVKINDRLMKHIADSDIKIDEERCEKIINNFHNKYTLGENLEYYDKVLFLPGSNLLSKSPCVHWGRVKQCVDEGYKIKPHPITAHIWIAKLKQDFGEENVLEKKAGGFELLVKSKDVATMPNSEMGLMALMLDKNLRMVSHTKEKREKSLLTYESIYLAIANRNAKEALMKIFSAKNSGIIFSFDDDAEDRLQQYLNNFWSFKVFNG